MDQMDTGIRPTPPETPRWTEALAPREPRARYAVVAEAERSATRKTVSLRGAAPVAVRSEEMFSLVVLYLLKESNAHWGAWSHLGGIPRITVAHRTVAGPTYRKAPYDPPGSGEEIFDVPLGVVVGGTLRPDMFGNPSWSAEGVTELAVTGPRQPCRVHIRGYDLADMPVAWERIPTAAMYDARRLLVERWSGSGS